MRLAQEYKKVLNNKFGENFAVFDYTADFQEFWMETIDEKDNSLPAPKIIEAARNKALIIIWEEMSGVDEKDNLDNLDKQDVKFDAFKLLAPHLTPLDWTLTISMKLLKASEDLDFRIHIVDLTVKKYEDTFVSHMRATLLAEMPWVSLYAPLVPNDGNNETARYRRGYKNITELINIEDGSLSPSIGTAVSVKGQEKSVKQALSRIAEAWRSSLIQSDDHHDLNNIIGASVASDDNSGPPLIRAFCRRLAFSGHLLLEKTSANDQNNVSGINADVLVIDDMLPMGWNQYLCKALGAKPEYTSPFESQAFVRFGKAAGGLKLYGCTSAAALINSWKIQSPPLNQRNFGYRFLPDSSQTSHGEILFLDLRLGNIQAIKAQAQDLLDLFKDFLKGEQADTSSLAWIAIDQGEQDRIKSWCDNPNASEGTDGFVDAITLLPRICALINPLVPIVLFSSTARADIKQKLSRYRNIYCGFEKPQVLKQPRSVAESFIELNYQLRDCKQLIALRRSLEFVEKEALKVAEIRKNNPDLFQFKSVECFVDESGTKKLLSGTFVLLSKCEGTADEINNDLESGCNCVKSTKHSLYSEDENGKEEKRRIRTECAKCVKEKFSGFNSNDYQTLGVGFYVSHSDFNKNIAGDLFSSKHPEQKLDWLLRFTVDFNGAILPWYLKYSSEIAKFCFDVRSLPEDDSCERQRRNANFGFAEVQINQRMGNKTYDESSYFPLFREATLRWPSAWWKLKPVLIRGYSLTRKSTQKSTQRYCHYFADWVSGALRESSDQSIKFLEDSGIVKECNIYRAEATKNKYWLLESFRLAVHGAREEAIVHLLLHNGITSTEPQFDEPDNPKIEQILLLGIYEHALKFVQGNALFQALLADKDARKIGLADRDISSQSYENNGLPQEPQNTVVNSFTVTVVKYSSKYTHGWEVKDETGNNYFLTKTFFSEEHKEGDELKVSYSGGTVNHGQISYDKILLINE